MHSTISNPPKIVCFYPWKPFEPSGAWTRFSCFWRYLLNEGAQVTLAFMDKGENTTFTDFSTRWLSEFPVNQFLGAYAKSLLASETKSELKQLSDTELSLLLMYDPDILYKKANLTGSIEELVQSHDLVTCEYPMYAPLLSPLCRKHDKKLLITSHDALYELHGKHPFGKEKLKTAEAAALKLADAVVYCNEAERDLFVSSGIEGEVIPSCGDALAVTPRTEAEAPSPLTSRLPLKTQEFCLFVGSRHGPNQEAVEEIKRYAKAMPKLTFVVAGSAHAALVDDNFTALGPVTERVLDALYRDAKLILIPLFAGTGMSIKTFQALAYGKAIVSTAVGIRGYPVVHGKDVLIAQSPNEISGLIRRCLGEPALKASLEKNARTLAQELDFRNAFKAYAPLIRRLLPAHTFPRAKSPSALILVDNTLKDTVGHHYNYARSILEASQEQGHRFRSLVSKHAAPDILADLQGTAIFGQGIHSDLDANPYPQAWHELHAQYAYLKEAADFAAELETGVGPTLSSEDLVFLPNATPAQILGLGILLQQKPAYRVLRYRVLMRYSLTFGTGPIHARKPATDRAGAERYQQALNRLLSVDQLVSLKLTTDSTELAKEYAALFQVQVQTLPIPHTQSGGTKASAFLPPKENRRRIVFLGDARDEKGFELLPALVRGVSAISTNPVEFVFQAFVSSPYHGRMATVIDDLERLKKPNVHLLKRSLTQEEYETVLHSADIVLIPYDAITYKARTSGPFVEALCAQKPVVVPRQSWMSLVLGDSQAGATFNSGNVQDLVRATQVVLQNLERAATAARLLGTKLAEEHNPQNFIKRLRN